MTFKTLLLCAALLIPNGTAIAQSIDWYQQATRTVLRNSRKLIEPTLEPSQAGIARDVGYRVTGSSGIGAFAAFEDGRRVIVIHGGTVQMMDWFFDAIFIDEALGHEGCYQDYQQYLADAVDDNTRRVRRHLPPKAVASPMQYALDGGGSCGGASKEEFAQSAEYQQLKPRAIEASIMFVYLHELGHHINGDTLEKRTDDPIGLKMAREQEDAADRFAVLTALKAGYYVSAATPWFAFMAAFGGNSIEAETKSDHPLGIHRALTVYEETLSYLKRSPEAWPDRATYADAISDLERQVADVRNTVKAIR